MATRNVGGHGVSSAAGAHNQQAMPAMPTFTSDAGASGHKSPKGGKGFPPKSAPTKSATAGPYGGPMAV